MTRAATKSDGSHGRDQLSTGRPLLAYVADDFTGATDALEAFSLAGFRTVLHLDPPKELPLDEAGRPPEVIGVATTLRALPTSEIDAELRPIIRDLRALQPQLVHYKVCSTFDSSANVGSIGRALEIGLEETASTLAPVVVGVPQLGRYCAFGHLFARDGHGVTHRLDRHPIMSRHPVTPMDESDLRIHLGRQTDVPIDLLSIAELDDQTGLQDPSDAPRALLIDVVSSADQLRVGSMLWSHAQAGLVQFVVGSSGVSYALVRSWGARTSSDGCLTSDPEPGAVLAVSGSCSSTSRAQIEGAIAAGWQQIHIDGNMRRRSEFEASVAQAIDDAVRYLRAGADVVVHSTPANEMDVARHGNTEVFSRLLADIASGVIERHELRRLLVCGGDTSGVVGRQIGVRTLRYVMPIAPGAPLCSADLGGRRLEVAFKGGQIGPPDYFERVRLASSSLDDRDAAH